MGFGHYVLIPDKEITDIIDSSFTGNAVMTPTQLFGKGIDRKSGKSPRFLDYRNVVHVESNERYGLPESWGNFYRDAFSRLIIKHPTLASEHLIVAAVLDVKPDDPNCYKVFQDMIRPITTQIGKNKLMSSFSEIGYIVEGGESYRSSQTEKIFQLQFSRAIEEI